jgi:hypothetical protein
MNNGIIYLEQAKFRCCYNSSEYAVDKDYKFEYKSNCI